MNNFKKKSESKSFLYLIVATLLSLVMAFAVACDNGSTTSESESSSSETIAEKTDYQTIANGDFEFGTANSKTSDYPVYSSISWSRANDSNVSTAVSSTYKSGIIDTKDSVFSKIASNIYTDDDKLNGEYFNPHTPYENGLTAEGKADEGYPTQGSKVLMIRNFTSVDDQGTAQKFTSSSTISLVPYDYAEISVWVNTYNLKSIMTTGEYGAYVKLTTTLGGKEKNPIVIKNINTDGEWVKYTVYVASCNYATTNLKVVLGLGMGSNVLKAEYVEGYAFFDNVSYKSLTKAEYEQVTANKDVNFYNLKDEASKDDLTVKANTVSGNYSLNVNFEMDSEELSLSNADVKLNNVYKRETEDYGKKSRAGVANFNSINVDASNPFGNKQTLYFVNEQGASYTYETNDFTVAPDEYLRLTFWAKVKTNSGAKGLTVKVVDDTDKDNTSTTEVVSNFNTNKFTNDNFDDWARIIAVVANVYGDDITRSFHLEFDFGPTEDTLDIREFPVGYGLVTNFEFNRLNKDEYNQVYSSDANYKYVTLSADRKTAETEEKDSYGFTYSIVDGVSIKDAPATTISGFYGIVGNSANIGGSDTANKNTQDSTVSGLINTEYLDNYVSAGIITSEQKDAIKSLKTEGENKYAQPLFIKNNNSCYGYIQSSSSTLSASTTTLVTVKVAVLGGANAYVYLTDTKQDSATRFEVLSIKAENTSTNEKVDGTFQTKISADKYGKLAKNGWVEVKFIVTTGNEDISYRVECFNGSRDGKEKSSGIVLIGSIETETLDSASLTTQKAKLAKDYSGISGFEFNTDNGSTFTRLPSTVKNDDGTTTQTYTKGGNYSGLAFYTNGVVTLADYSNIDIENEIDNTTPEQEEESTSNDEPTNTKSSDWGLYITTLLLAAVLIAVLVVILVRKVFVKKKSTKKSTRGYYDRDARTKTQAKISNSKTAKVQLAEKDETVGDYDYENMDNNLVEQSTTEQSTADEQPTDEPADEPKAEEQPEEQPAEQPVEESTTDEQPAEQPTEEPKADEPAEEPKADEPAEEPKAEEQPAEQPTEEQPTEEKPQE